MSKIKLWPSDATTLPEKIAYAAMKIGVPALYLFMQFSAWGIFKNIYEKNVAASPAGWHVLGFVLSVASVIWVYEASIDSPIVTKSTAGNTAIAVIGAIISLAAYAGFVFNG